MERERAIKLVESMDHLEAHWTVSKVGMLVVRMAVKLE